MKYGCCAGMAQIEQLKKIGFDFIEFRGRDVAAMDKFEFEDMKRRLEKAQLRCLGFNAYCGPEIKMAGPEFNRAYAKQYADCLAARGEALGAAHVGVGSPQSRVIPDDFNREQAFEQTAVLISDMAASFAKAGMTVGIESLGSCYCNHIVYMRDAVRLMQTVDLSNVGLVVDFYHLEYNHELSYDLKAIVDKITHVHMSDDIGSPWKRSFLKPEKAEEHARRVRRLIDAGYSGGVSLEPDVAFDATEAAQSLKILQNA